MGVADAGPEAETGEMINFDGPTFHLIEPGPAVPWRSFAPPMPPEVVDSTVVHSFPLSVLHDVAVPFEPALMLELVAVLLT